MPVCPSCNFEGPGNFCSNCGSSYTTGRPAARSGSCLIPALVIGAVGVVFLAIFGIIAAIAIPNFLNAVQRGRQKRTMADMRMVAVGLDSYAVDWKTYPVSPGGEWTETSDLAPLLEPTYVDSLPLTDAWAQPLRFRSDGSRYEILSTAKDMTMDVDPPIGPTRNFDCDIRMSDGAFVSWPEGTQR